MYLLFRSFVRPLLWALSPLRELGTPESDDDFFDPRTGTQRDPHQPREDVCPKGTHRKVAGGPCVEDEVVKKRKKCGDHMGGQTRAWYKATNDRLKRTCRTDRGYKWVAPKNDCSLGSCDPIREPPPPPPTDPCKENPNQPGCPGYVPPTVPEPVRTEQERIKRILDRGEKVTPKTLLKAAEEEGAAFDPMVGQPAKLAPHSLADVLADPRYLAAAAERERGTRRAAGALGLAGAPVLSAIDEGKRNLLGPMSNLIFGQNLQQHGADVRHGQDTYNRLTGNWQRWWEPTRYGTDYPLRLGGLALGAGNLGLAADDQRFRHWWLPESQQRGFGEARWHAGQGNLMSIINALAGAQYGGIQQPGWS